MNSNFNLLLFAAACLAFLAAMVDLVIIYLLNKQVNDLRDEVGRDRIDIDELRSRLPDIQKRLNAVRESPGETSKSQDDTTDEQDAVSLDEEGSEPKEEQGAALYANASADPSGFFGQVSEKPGQQTIFKLDIDRNNPDKASYSVWTEAERKVLEDSNFLENLCEIEAVGTHSRIVILEKGNAEKIGGRWRKVKPLRVKFE